MYRTGVMSAALLAGCYMEATAGLGKRTSQYGGGLCGTCGLTEEVLAPTGDIGLGLGVEWQIDRVDVQLGGQRTHFPGRDSNVHDGTALDARLDIVLATLPHDLAIGVFGAIARFDRYFGSAAWLEGTEYSAGVALRWHEFDVALGARTLDFKSITTILDDPYYNEQRRGAQLRARYRFGGRWLRDHLK